MQGSPVDLGFVRWQAGESTPRAQDSSEGGGTRAESVLIVDDNPHLREIASAMLRHHGYRVLTAPDGREALRVAREHAPDLVLMDIDMPRMDGLEATRELREDEGLSGVPVVVLTAHREAAYLQRAVQAGATAYLRKPFHPRDLLAAVQRILDPLPARANPGAAARLPDALSAPRG